MFKKFIIFLFIFITTLFSTVQAEESLKINSINFDNSDNIIFLTAANKVQYINVKSMKLSNPDRICFDIDNAVLTQKNASWTFKNSLIKQVKLSQFTTEPHVVRLVITYNKGFNPNKLKLYRIDNNIIFIYDKKLFAQGNFGTVYNDQPAIETYYEYTTFEKDEKLTQQTVPTPALVRSPEALEIQKAFNANSELNKPAPQLPEQKERENKLKSNFTVNSIDIKRGNALIRGFGSIALEKTFTLDNPKRLVIDMPNTYVSPEIRNQEYVLGENETIKIGQNESSKARIVITSDDIDKFRPIFSYDRQSIFLGHDDRMLGLKLYDKTAAIYTYAAKKMNETTDVMQFLFTEPIIHSIKKLDGKVEINLHNASGFNREAFNKNLDSEVFAKLRTEQLPECGIKLIVPIKKNTIVCYQQSYDNKQLRLALINPKESEMTQGKTSFFKRNPNVKTIIIDAGHGGSDVGATREGVFEKDLNLDIAERLQKALEKKGLDVKMVRTKDVYVSLEERVEFCDKHEGDIFVSIHVNSSVTPDGNGLETHYYTPQSYDFAQIVHKEFTSAINAKDRGLFKSKFYVINHTTCPSILIETGFISNPEEREELLTTQRRQKTAEAIAKGILKYLGKN